MRCAIQSGKQQGVPIADVAKLAELDQRIATLRENIRQLIEQATAQSGAADAACADARITEQDAKLSALLKKREAEAKRTAGWNQALAQHLYH